MLPGVEYARRRRFHQGGSLDSIQHWASSDRRNSRRSSFCLYQSEYLQKPQHHSTPRCGVQQQKEKEKEKQQHGEDVNKLQEVAREARERLDERLRAAYLSNNKRRSSFWGMSSSQQAVNNGDLEEVWPSNIRGRLASAASATEARRPADSVAQNGLPIHQTSSKMGLSQASIDLLQKETFTSKDSRNYNRNSVNGRNSQQDECPVCLEGFHSGQVLIHLPCTHRFHSSCLIPWLNTHCHCPCCRTRISIKAP
uniref:TSA: Wollemia nobilis Ref_Wollemi_Transcript_4128_968 transcribed RNA sequence n=1 Tax=Wollemia nobilis TaxID=56998 RepID=A0A0C9S8N4_9CONI